jgi:hypothetical protein
VVKEAAAAIPPSAWQEAREATEAKAIVVVLRV